MGDGIGGDTTSGVLTRLHQVTSGKPSQVFLLIGTNDVSFGESDETIVDNIVTILERFADEAPETEVFVQSILPRGATYRDRIESLNSKIQAAIGELHEQGRSLQTCQHYLRAIKQFSRWLFRDGRVREDVLAHLSGFNPSIDRRYERRPLSAEELRLLIDTAEQGRPWRRMPGRDRAMLYRLAAGTGFRAGELRSLTPASFHLNDDPPYVVLQASHSKHSRESVRFAD